MIPVETRLGNLTMIEKIAHFLVLMGEDVTIKIFEALPKHLVEDISTHIVGINAVDKDLTIAILDEFYIYAQSKNFISSGGYDYAREILYKTLPKEEADKILEKLSKARLSSQAFNYLTKIDAVQLADFIKDESPQTLAIILSHMDTMSAAETLNVLSDEQKVQVTMQMATIEDVSPHVVKTVSAVLEKKLESLLSSIVDVGGTKVVADILNRLGQDKSKEILGDINEYDSKIAAEIKEKMFIFEDMLALDVEALQKILQNVDNDVVAMALKNSTEEQYSKTVSAMSQRARDRFEEEFEMLTKVKIKDIEASQRTMLDVAAKLIEEGVIDRGEEETYG